MLHIETTISKGTRSNLAWHVGEPFPILTLGEMACLTLFQADGDELEFFREIDEFDLIPPHTDHVFRTTDRQTCIIAYSSIREYFKREKENGYGAHFVCALCWDSKNPGRLPHYVIASPGMKACCYCGGIISDWVYVRDKNVNCMVGGEHA